jgi:bifunctional DNA-binding transcriptional regulator/antitoxin component of YhaV-PrlF toxin-antitoxin module
MMSCRLNWIIDALGLKPGAELVFERDGDAIVMRPVKTNTIPWVEEGPRILGYTGSTVSQEEMDDVIAMGAVSRKKNA